MLFQLVRFQAEQILIAHLSVERGMLNGAFERLLERLRIGLPPVVGEETSPQLGLEVIRGKLPGGSRGET